MSKEENEENEDYDLSQDIPGQKRKGDIPKRKMRRKIETLEDDIDMGSRFQPINVEVEKDLEPDPTSKHNVGDPRSQPKSKSKAKSKHNVGGQRPQAKALIKLGEFQYIPEPEKYKRGRIQSQEPPIPVIEPPEKRKRGRPKKKQNPEKDDVNEGPQKNKEKVKIIYNKTKGIEDGRFLLANDKNITNKNKIPEYIEYPFTTKYIKNKKYLKRRLPLPHSNLNSLKIYQRPYFSPKFHSYEMDYFNTGIITLLEERVNESGNIEMKPRKVIRHYLMIININTKFAVVYPVKHNYKPSSPFTIYCLKDLMKRYEITNIRGDKDPAFSGELFRGFLKANNIKPYFTPSRFTNENRVVDRAIKTIRDGVGADPELLLYYPIVAKMVYFYNNTPHSAYKNKFTPQQVQNDRELEAWYIRTQQLKLFDILQLQLPFMKYKPGDLLLVHLSLAKTQSKFRKQRRNFNELATFIMYDCGNVVARLLKTGEDVTLPIYYTMFISSGAIPQGYEILRSGVPPPEELPPEGEDVEKEDDEHNVGAPEHNVGEFHSHWAKSSQEYDDEL
jgi:hypothetical protein